MNKSEQETYLEGFVILINDWLVARSIGGSENYKKIEKDDSISYQCEECGFRYEEQAWAKKCEAWCKEHKSCNVEITSSAIENKKIK